MRGCIVSEEFEEFNVKELISPEEIEDRIQALSGELHDFYYEKNPVLLIVLKGAYIFGADLSRQLGFSHDVEFVKITSYVNTRSTLLPIAPAVPFVEDRHVLIVEDIVDTGRTWAALGGIKAKSLKMCSLLSKGQKVDYLGFMIPDKFVVGYGMDFDERFRGLPGIYTMEEEDE